MITIEHPLTCEKLQVANNDFSDRMNWENAIDACEKLGIGWRLPTMEELEMMYENLHKKGEGNFKFHYWSSLEYGRNDAWAFNFGTGNAGSGSKGNTTYVRAVRAL